MKVSIVVEVASQEEANAVAAKIFGGATTIAHGGAPAPLAGLGGQSNDEEDDGAQSNANVHGQVDKDGLPWDERIHSSNKKITAKGVWTRRKGVDNTVFEQVANELRNRGAAPAPQQYAQAPAPQQYQQQPAPQQYAQAPAPVHVPQAPPQQAPQQYAQAPAPQQYAQVPQQDLSQIPQHMQQQPAPQQYAQAPAPQQHVPQAPVHQPAPQQAGGQTFGDLFNKIQSLFAQGTDPNYVISLQQRLGHQFGVQINSINDISNRADIVAAAFTLLAQDGK